ncbi:hypothetical protein ABFW14_27890 [Mycolicibacterium fortuitum]|uniref:hypothetical protein n=1 Tax=Mycolicibacterium TaxID=1866885 RepID=UPI0034CEC9C4
MTAILRFATSTTALTAQSALDSASAWAGDHPTVILAMVGTMVAVTAITAAIRALRRYLRLALLMLLLSLVPLYPTSANADLPPPPPTPSLFR